MAAIGTDATTQAWWKLTDPPARRPGPIPGTPGRWSDQTEIRHLHLSQGNTQ